VIMKEWFVMPLYGIACYLAGLFVGTVILK
jgi:hypothetical protein